MEKMKDKDGKTNGCCTSHRCEILGVIMLAIAVVLTLLTFNGAGIFGMFIAGLVFCCHKHWGCRRCHCGCCGPEMTHCDMPTPKKATVVAARKTTTKTTTKK